MTTQTREKVSVAKRSVESLAVAGRRVLVRVDYNVPMDKSRNVTDDTRIQASLPTLRHLCNAGARVILLSHWGRPKGKKDPSQSLEPAAKVLEKLLGRPVRFFPDCRGEGAREAAARLKEGEVLLLENLRFYPGEEKNDPAFAAELAQLGDCFVQDAFGAVHRAHASTEALAKLLPSAAGLLLERELSYLSRMRRGPMRPYVAILGGAKVSDKIAVLEALLESVNSLVIGGAMAYTFLAAQGVSTGASRTEPDHLETARRILSKARESKVRVVLPVDHRVVDAVDKPETIRTTPEAAIPEGRIGVDVGPGTIREIEAALSGAKTIFWNGPLGIFETPAYAEGTRAVAKALASLTKRGAVTVVGGGDSAAAVKSLGLESSVSHVSTGGGASLEFIEGRELPGVTALPDA